MKRFERVRELDIAPARFLNLALAGWLLVSAFLWRHSEPQFLSTIFVGVVVSFFAPFELGSAWVRWINTIAGVILVVCALVLPRSSWLSTAHNVIVGLLLVGLSFYGPPHGHPLPPRPPCSGDEYNVGGIH